MLKTGKSSAEMVEKMQRRIEKVMRRKIAKFAAAMTMSAMVAVSLAGCGNSGNRASSGSTDSVVEKKEVEEQDT